MEELLEGTAPREELERTEAELARVAAALEEARRQHVNDMEDVLEGTVPRDEHEALQAELSRLAEEAAELRRQAEEPAGADKAELEASRQEAARLAGEVEELRRALEEERRREPAPDAGQATAELDCGAVGGVVVGGWAGGVGGDGGEGGCIQTVHWWEAYVEGKRRGGAPAAWAAGRKGGAAPSRRTQRL